MDIERRIYKPELRRITGWSNTWIRDLEKKKKIPPGRKDVGGRRKWWPESEVRAMAATGPGADPNPAPVARTAPPPSSRRKTKPKQIKPAAAA